VVLVAFVGLGIDGANAFAQRRNANIAADAAAMAGARALLDGKLDSSHDHNLNVYDAIDTYLTTHLPGGGGTSTITWDAYFISRTDGAVGGKLQRNSSALPTIDVYDTSANAIRGISVEVHYTFNTYFMLLIGRDTLNVQAYGLAFVGPLGGATGLDVVPLAINRTEASYWSRLSAGTEYDLDMFGTAVSFSNRTASPRPLIGTADLRQVTLLPDGPTPTLGTVDACDNYDLTSPEDALNYWWCKGTPHRLVSDTKQSTLALPMSNTMANALKDAVDWRIANAERSTVLFPIYERVNDNGSIIYNIRGFIAVRLKSRSSNLVRGELVKYYSAPGPINGNTSGYFGTYAINLVQ
jgi:hypothetical protein